MSRIQEIVQCVFVSPEFGWILFVGAIKHWKPQWLSSACATLLVHPDAYMIALVGIPVFLLRGTYKLAERLRRPVPEPLALKGWRDYGKLMLWIRIAHLWILLSIPSVLVGLILIGKQKSDIGGALVLGGVGVSGISFLSIADAVPSQEDIIEGM